PDHLAQGSRRDPHRRTRTVDDTTLALGDAVTSALPERAADTSAENPWPVRLLSMKIGEYVDKMSVVWIEGQVVQLNRRPGSSMAYLTLRDVDVDMSFSVAIRVTALDAMPPLQEGARVVTQ